MDGTKKPLVTPSRENKSSARSLESGAEQSRPSHIDGGQQQETRPVGERSEMDRYFVVTVPQVSARVVRNRHPCLVAQHDAP